MKFVVVYNGTKSIYFSRFLLYFFFLTSQRVCLFKHGVLLVTDKEKSFIHAFFVFICLSISKQIIPRRIFRRIEDLPHR